MRLVIFDVDGTLMRSTQLDEACFVRALEEDFGIVGVDTNWLGYTHSTDSGIIREVFERRFGRPPLSAELSRFQQRFLGQLERALRETPGCCDEVPGARAALAALQRHAVWAAAIATGSWRALALRKLHAAGLPVDGFPAAFADDGIAREEILQTAMERARRQYAQPAFQRVVYMGDAVWDVRAAARLRLSFIGIGEQRRAAVLQQEGARRVLRDLSDVDLLLRLLDEAPVPG
jgi:phosphoglycolate phosphatase-like HAD superfamily hydrolase